MLGFKYMKSTPTTYVLQYKSGKLIREGPGLSFFYYAPTSTLVAVPLSSVDVPFVFNEVTADFQSISLQGQLSYRIIDAKKVSSLLDFSIYPSGAYASEDPKKLDERLVGQAQVLASAITHRAKLRDVLTAQEQIVSDVLAGLRASQSVAMLGVEVMGLAITAIKPTPETSKALEAEAREQLLRQSDEAIYARRNAAVAQERLIKESELNTEIAVEEKRRQIRETKMSADIAVEQQRAGLIERQVENDRKEAEAKGYALEATLRPLRDMDWRTLTALSAGKMDPKLSIAMAFRDLADNASKIGSVNITSELLQSLLAGDGTAPHPPELPTDARGRAKK